MRTDEREASSQYGQDRFVAQTVYRGRRGLTFLDIGAADGLTLSNTAMLERDYGWRGLCIEASPVTFAALSRNRQCPCLCLAAGEAPGSMEFLDVEGPAAMLSGLVEAIEPAHIARIEREIAAKGGRYRRVPVPVRPMAEVAREHGLTRIDYVSLDVEGGELATLRGLLGKGVSIGVLTVEDNYGNTGVKRILAEHGFVRFARLKADDVYIAASELTPRLRAAGWPTLLRHRLRQAERAARPLFRRLTGRRPKRAR